ncbi:MAG: histidine kinase N-terminal 7TM domain-containing protein [Anaerolineales bacterium]
MTWQFTPYIIFTLLPVAIASAVAYLAWQRRAVPGTPFFIAVMLALIWWSGFYMVEMVSTDREFMIRVAQMQYLGIVSAPVCWFLFVLSYTGSKRNVTRPVVLALFAIPITVLGFVLTNDLHSLHWAALRENVSPRLVSLDITYGPVFWIHTVYSYALLFMSTLLLWRFARRSHSIYRNQARALAAGAFFPWLGNFVYLFDLLPNPNLDTTPFFFAVSGAIVGWAAFRYRLLDLIPIARWEMVHSMGDAILALDLQHRILDLNPIAEEILGATAAQAVGRSLSEILPAEEYERLVALLVTVPETQAVRQELKLATAEQTRYYDVRISSLLDHVNRRSGYLLVLHDVTERKILEASLEVQVQRIEKMLAIARATTHHLSLLEMLQNTLDIIVSLTQAERGTIFLLNEERRVTRSVMALADAPAVASETLTATIVKDGILGWLYDHQQVALIEDTHIDERWEPLPGKLNGTRSALGVPIVQGKQMIGVLLLQHPQPAHFSSRDAEMMVAATQQMALAIWNAQMYEEQRRMVEEQTILYEVLRALHQPRHPDQLVQMAVTTVAGITRWPLVAFVTLDKSAASLEVEAVAGEMAAACDNTLPVSSTLLERSWQEGKSFYTPNVHAVGEGLLELSDDSPIVSLLLVGLRQEKQVRRLLCIASDERNAFSIEERRLAEALGDVITLALRNAQLYITLQTELIERKRVEDRLWTTLRKTDSLYHISRSLMGTYELSEVFRISVQGAVRALNANRVLAIALDVTNGRVLERISSGADVPEVWRAPFAELLEGLVGWAIRENQPILATKEGPGERASSPKRRPAEMELGATIITPLTYMNDVYGVLIATNRPEQRDFTQQDVDLMLAASAQVASTIHNVRLFQQVIEEQRRLRALVQSSRDGVILVGMQLNILVINQPVGTYLGLSGVAEDWIGCSIIRLLQELRGHGREMVWTALMEIRRLQSGETEAREWESQVSNRILHWFNFPVPGEEGPLGRLVVIRDVTDARLLDRMREDLTHTMVHDLRNPLTGIHGSLLLLTKTVHHLPESSQELLEIAKNNTSRMLKLVNAILDISRLESGQMPLKMSTFPPRTLIGEVLKMEEPLAKQQNIQLLGKIPEDLPPIRADQELISRTLQNLVGNAIKFTPSGGRVKVEAQIKTETPDKVYFSVVDNGPGIVPELKERLFNKFVTGDDQNRGSGLGLAFCRMVLQSHGEEIWVDTAPGQGSTFTFTLSVSVS